MLITFLNYNLDETTAPDIQVFLCMLRPNGSFCRQWNFKEEVYDNYINKHFEDGQKWAVINVPVLLHPKSRGEITLASRDPFTHPLINPNYLQDKDDVRQLVQACQLIDQICQTEPLNNVLKSVIEEMNKDENSENQDQFWESYIRKYSSTVYHPIGTCKMGKEEDPMSVVTSDTRVKGVRGLRVIDGSIMPKLVSGNTNIPIIAMAERAADLIKNNS